MQTDADPDPAYYFDPDADPDFYLMRKRIQVTKMIRIQADPNPQYCFLQGFSTLWSHEFLSTKGSSSPMIIEIM